MKAYVDILMWIITNCDADANETQYNFVQQSTTVSCAGLPVLRTIYKPMSMHKSTNCRNCEFCVL